MSTTDEKRPKARSGQRSGKARQAGPKADQRQRAKAEPVQVETIVVEPAVSLSEIVPVEAVAVLDGVDAVPERVLDPVAPDPELGTAANYLLMLNGEAPDPRRARAIEQYLILADALEEQGEGQAAAHCREPLHAKGCHILDWILQKE